VGKGWESSARSDDPGFEKPAHTPWPIALCATVLSPTMIPSGACEAGPRRSGTDHIGLHQLHEWDGQRPVEETPGSSAAQDALGWLLGRSAFTRSSSATPILFSAKGAR
jgi:hypothetical protein